MHFRGGKLALFLFFTAPLQTQTSPPATASPVLGVGATVEGKVISGAVNAYLLQGVAGDFLEVSIDRTGNDMGVSATLFGPDGTQLQSGPEYQMPRLSLMAVAAAGTYRVEVRPLAAPGASYRIRLAAPRRASAQDQVRAGAWATLLEGNGLFAEFPRMTSKPREPVLRAIELFQRALTGFRSIGDRKDEATTLYLIGLAYRFINEFTRALDYLPQAQAIWHELSEPAEDLVPPWLGVIYRGLGRYDEALALWEQQRAAARAAKDPGAEAVSLLQMADTYDQMDDRHRQIQALQQASAIVKGRPGGMDNILLGRLADAYSKLRDYPTAIDYMRRRLAMARSRHNPPQNILEGMGELYETQGNYRKALECFLLAIPLKTGLAPKATTLGTVASLYSRLSEHAKALEYYTQALELHRSLKIPQSEALDLVWIGSTWWKLGNRQKALESLQLARQIWPETPPERTAVLYIQLAIAYGAAGEPQAALESFEKALSLRRAIRNPALEASLMAGAAEMERDLGNLPAARSHIEAALAAYESVRTRIYSPDLRASYFTGVRQYYDFYADLLMRLDAQEPGGGHAGEAFEVNERGRARSLLDILIEARADIRKGADPRLLDEERRLKWQLNARVEFQAQLLGGQHARDQEDAVQAEIRRLSVDLDQVEARIRRSSPAYAAFTNPGHVGFRELQQLLDPATTLLEYSLGDDRSYVWAVTRNSIAGFVLPPRVQIDKAARRVYELVTARAQHPKGETEDQRTARLTRAEAEYPRAAAALSRMILAPAGRLGANRRLVLVRDGALEYVPFSALPEPGIGEPLMVRHEIVTLPSLSVLAEVRRAAAARPKPAKTVAVLADPVFDLSDERVKRTGGTPPAGYASDLMRTDMLRSLAAVGLGGTIPRLPFTRREADAIVSLAPPGTAWAAIDFQASRTTALGPKLSQYRIVHFATHGLLNSDDPSLSGLVLSMVNQAGAPENGFLRLNEIYNLNLAADLVVLSACQTALGKEVRGEGLVGLTRGFLYAGAQRVAASLWKVDDSATADLMAGFYRTMFSGRLSPAAALRQAQLQTRAQPRWSQPFFWAAFELQGEWK